MRIYTRTIVAFLACLSFVLPVMAQEEVTLGPEVGEENPVLTAVIRSADKVEVGKNIIFDSSQSFNPLPDTEMKSSWNFGDNSRLEQGSEVVHSFSQPGTYTVQLTINNSEEAATTEKTIFVYEKLLVLFTYGADAEELEKAYKYAAEKNILLKIFDDKSSVSDLEATRNLAKSLSANKEDLGKAGLVMLWSKRANISLNALADFAKAERESNKDDKLNLSQKSFAIISAENLNILSRIAKGTYSVLDSKHILLVRQEALFTMIESINETELIGNLHNLGYEFKLVDEKSLRVGILNLMSSLVNYLRNSGVSSETLFLILMLPVIATLISIARQFLGVTTMGIYIPTILTLSFVSLGLTNTLIVLTLVWVVGTLTRMFFKRYRLMYVPRIAIIITITSLAFILLMYVGSFLQMTSFLQISIIPALIVMVLVEQILTLQMERGMKAATFLMVETLLVSMISFALLSLPSFQNLIIGYPELIIVLILINVFLGRWSGLRISELFRFRRLLDEVEHAEE